MATQPQKTNRS